MSEEVAIQGRHATLRPTVPQVERAIFDWLFRSDLTPTMIGPPLYPERPLDDPAMTAARGAVELVLKGHEPYPALAVDRHWRLVQANAALGLLLAGIGDAGLLEPPVNVLRLSLHPKGLAPGIANLDEWRGHILDRLRRQIAVSSDPALAALHQELSAYPGDERATGPRGAALVDYGGVAAPLRLATEAGVISFISTTTIFGAPRDVILSELAIEAFFPADGLSAERLRALWSKRASDA